MRVPLFDERERGAHPLERECRRDRQLDPAGGDEVRNEGEDPVEVPFALPSAFAPTSAAF